MFNTSRDNVETTNDDDGNTHKPEEFLTLFVVLSGNSNGSSREFVYLLGGTCFLRLFTLSLCFLSPLETFRELHMHARQ